MKKGYSEKLIARIEQRFRDHVVTDCSRGGEIALISIIHEILNWSEVKRLDDEVKARYVMGLINWIDKGAGHSDAGFLAWVADESRREFNGLLQALGPAIEADEDIPLPHVEPYSFHDDNSNAGEPF